MPVAAPEAPTNPDSPPETSWYRNLYIVLLVCGFILRFGFVLWKKTYIGSPNDNIPFGEEICSIADHIVRGQGFSSPFHQDTGPTAWIAPVYPYLVALVFRLLGSYSVASATVLLGIQCIIAASTGITIHALGRRTFGARILRRVDLGAQPLFSAGQFPGFGILPPAPFFFPRPSSLRSMSRRKYAEALAIARRALGGDRAHQSRFAQRHAVYLSLRGLCEPPLLQGVVRFRRVCRCALRGAGFTLADPQRTRLRAAGSFSQQLLV